MPVNQNHLSGQVASGLPPVVKARPSSSTERVSWGKVLTSQRKMSLDGVNQREQEQFAKTPNRSMGGRKTEKERCPRLNRTYRGHTSDGIDVIEVNKVREKPERQSDLVKILSVQDADPGDDPLVLEGALMLEKFDQSSESTELNQSSSSWITLVDCRMKLQRLLLEKIKTIAEEDCINLIQDGQAYIRRIETIYTEDQYKLETARTLTNLPEKDRKLALNDFMGTSQKRKGLPGETKTRFNSWIADLNNCSRLLNINYRVPKQRLTVLMVEQTAVKLEKMKLTILHWLSLTLTIDVQIMSIYWDHLPFEVLNDLFTTVLTFNDIWPTHTIDPIRILSTIQAEAASNRISFLIQTEAKKITSALRRRSEGPPNVVSDSHVKGSTKLKDTERPESQTTSSASSPRAGRVSQALTHSVKDGTGSTSDYFTQGTISNEGSTGESKNFLSIASRETIDLASYLSIVLTSSQRIVLKLSFILQTASTGSSLSSVIKGTARQLPSNLNTSSKRKRNSSRATWTKVGSPFCPADCKGIQSCTPRTDHLTSNLYKYQDNVYWSVFWSNFSSSLLDNILFAQNCLHSTSGSLSSPLFYAPRSYQNLVYQSLNDSLTSNDFPSEAIRELKSISKVLFYHLTDQTWFKLYLNLYEINSDRSNQIFGSNGNISYVPEAVDIIQRFVSISKLDDDLNILQVYSFCSLKQIDSLLRSMINHTTNLCAGKPIKDLITFYKDIQVLDRPFKSIQSDKSSSNHPNQLLSLLKDLIETLETKIVNGIQKLSLQTFAHRIGQQKGKNSSNSMEPIIPYVKHLILDPNLELLSDCPRTVYINQLKVSMVSLFAKIIYQIVTSDGSNGQIRLTKSIRVHMKQEIIDFLRDHRDWLRGQNQSQQSEEVNDLEKLIVQSQTKTSEWSLFRRFNRIHPISRNIWTETQAAYNLNDLQRCGCLLF